MKTVAVLGASGFIGTRIVEMLHLGDEATVRPIVRTSAHIARLSRFALDSRVADARDQAALAEAFSGCDTVVHAIAGSPQVIVDAIEPALKLLTAVSLLLVAIAPFVAGAAVRAGRD